MKNTKTVIRTIVVKVKKSFAKQNMYTVIGSFYE